MTIRVKNKTGTIIGFGRSGVAAAHLILRLGGKVKVSDIAPAEKIDQILLGAGLHGKILVESGQHTKEFICDSDFLVLSPGVRLDALPVQWARERNIPVFGEIEFAWAFCRNPVIAVTGSNGKTTTVTLIHQILERAGKKACLCGNVGTPFTKYVLDLAKDEIVVLEVSSFQLETISSLKPHVGIILNCTQNHLDRHKDLEEYFSAKKRIFMNQGKEDFAILNHDDPNMKILAKALKANVLFFNDSVAKAAYPKDNPNFLAARCASKLFGVDDHTIDKVFAEFKGVTHRLEWVRSIQGIAFINDSKSTTVEAGCWALERMDKPVVIICGGREKNTDFSGLRGLVKKKVKNMFVIGEAREKIMKTFSDIVPAEECSSLPEALTKSFHKAEKGDCILFSPMCKSFDMFTNFEERGKEYKRLVKEL